MSELDTRAIHNAVNTVGLSTAFGRLSAASPVRDPSAVDAGLLDSFAQLLTRTLEPSRRAAGHRDIECEAADLKTEGSQSRDLADAEVSSLDRPPSEEIDVRALDATQSRREDEIRIDRQPGIDSDAAAIAGAQRPTETRQAVATASAMGRPLLADATSSELLSESPDQGLLGAGRSQLSNVLSTSQGDIQTVSEPTLELPVRDLRISPPANSDQETSSKSVSHRRIVDRAASSAAIAAEATHSMARAERGKHVEGSGDYAASVGLRSDRRHPGSGDDSSAAISPSTTGTASATVDSATLIDVAKLNVDRSGMPASSASNMPVTQSSGMQTSIVSEHATHAMTVEAHAVSHSRGHELTSARSEHAQRSTIDHFRLIQRVSKAFAHLGRDGGEIRLRLAPPELGTLQLEMQIHDRSILARIQTDSETASAALREHLPELRQRLESLGMRIEKLEVQSGLDDRGDEARQDTDAGQHAFHQSWRERGSIASKMSEPSRSPEATWRVAPGVDTQGTPPSALEGVDICL